MTKDEALRLALEALSEAHYVVEHRQDVKKREQAITAIKAALANEALDKMAENARELGLDYYVPCCTDKTCPKCKAALEAKDGECKHCTDGCPACDARKLPEQEPVAWAKFSAKGNIIDLLSEPDDDYTPLYTTPPQRTWVGLTEEELSQIEGTHIGRSFAHAIEAKLKEKNNG